MAFPSFGKKKFTDPDGDMAADTETSAKKPSAKKPAKKGKPSLFALKSIAK